MRFLLKSQPPFRFSAAVSPLSRAEDWAVRLRTLSELGYATLTTTDHVRTGGVWATVIAAAAAAPHARVGPIVVNADLSHPIDIAREAITADLVTNGRVELGIGAGWDSSDYAAHGQSLRMPAERLERLTEAITIIKELIAGRSISFEGKHFSVCIPAHEALRPVQTPLPLLIGGGGPKMLEVAATHADIVSIHRNLRHGHAQGWLSDRGKTFGERLAAVHSRIAKRTTPVELHALLLRAVVTDRKAEERERIAAAYNISPTEVGESPHFVIGTADDIADQLRERRERWGISYFSIVEAADQLSFGPVVSELAGT